MDKKKILLILYFIIFILLNIFDFLNALPQDIDFLKKILSWSLICYLFYKVSFTKIFIGQRLKSYDISYIIAFCLLTIPRQLLHYLSITQINTFQITSPIISIIEKLISVESFLEVTTLSSLVLIILTNIRLLENFEINKNSFLDSLKLKENYFKKTFEHLSLLLITTFFALIIAPFFLEWFALSVDALILVLGLIFYIIKYIREHTSHTKTSKLLNEISNTGNSFFQNIIKSFSNKTTFFIGISFLLTIHLLVDAGVYLIPYSIGTQSSLYFETLDKTGTSHTPIFNFFDNSNSQIYKELNPIITSNNLSLSDKIIDTIFMSIIYLSTLIFGFILAIFPFYFIYKHLNNKSLNLNKYLIIFILTLSCISLTTQLMDEVQMPIHISPISDSNINGIDVHTTTISQSKNISSINFTILILISLITIAFIQFRFEKYQTYFRKITYIIFLIFFVGYILTFYSNYNQNFFEKFESESSFNEVNKEIISNNLIPTKNFSLDSIKIEEEIFSIKGSFYSNSNIFKGHLIKKDENQNPFFLSQNSNIKTDKKALENFIISNKKSIEFIIITNQNEIKEVIKKLQNQNINENQNAKQDYYFFIHYLTFFFSSIFYILGIIIFSSHYIKTIFRKEI